MAILKNLRLVSSKKAMVILNLISEKLSLKTCFGSKSSNHQSGSLYQVPNKMAKFDWLLTCALF